MPTIDRTTVAYHDASNTRLRKIGTYTGPASYATGGDPCTPGDLGLGKVHVIFFEHASNGTVILLARYDATTEKVKWFDLAGAEVANATALSAYTARFEAIGL